MLIFPSTPFDRGSQRTHSYSWQQLLELREGAKLLTAEDMLHMNNSAVGLRTLIVERQN